MLKLTAKKIGEALGYTYHDVEERTLRQLVTDSRQIQPGDLFVAIVGERVDGHEYIQQALDQGAACVVISDGAWAQKLKHTAYILVEDGVTFIQRLGRYIRQKSQLPVIAVTGSSGKTTTKDLLSIILEKNGPLVATKGNNNNELGLPLTLCRIDETTEAVVVEMGMRGLGQIDILCRMAEPDYGIITNIGKVHCELLGSQQNIAKAKAELLPFISADGTVALNTGDRHFLADYAAECAGHVVWCSTKASQGDAWAEDIIWEEEGTSFTFVWAEERQRIRTNLQGVHNVQNILQVLVIARALGVPWAVINEALSAAQLTAMRMEKNMTSYGVCIYNDAYNANPDSMKAALSVLAAQSGRRIAVLGDMYELGQYEAESHREIGALAMALGIERLIVVGRLGRLIGQGAEKVARNGAEIYYAADSKEAATLLQQLMVSGDAILVKGSRGMQMEEIVQIIMG